MDLRKYHAKSVIIPFQILQEMKRGSDNFEKAG